MNEGGGLEAKGEAEAGTGGGLTGDDMLGAATGDEDAGNGGKGAEMPAGGKGGRKPGGKLFC